MTATVEFAHPKTHQTEAEPSMGVGWSKLMMWLFLCSDAMSFAGLLAAYGALRTLAPHWPNPAELGIVPLTAVNTFILICSSVTMVKGLSAIRHGDRKMLRVWLGATALGGAIFLGFQYKEWSALIVHEGVGVSRDLPAVKLVPKADQARVTDPVQKKALAAIEDLGRGGTFERVMGGASVKLVSIRALTEKLRAAKALPAERLEAAAGGLERVETVTALGKLGVVSEAAARRFEIDDTPLPKADRQRGLEYLATAALAAELEQAGVVKQEAIPALFGATFFILTGFHGCHVFGGVVLLLITLFRANRFTPERSDGVEVVGLYWHFVDLIWILVFTLIYLIPVPHQAPGVTS